MSGLGMVIAGGAARGAYQAGVLRFIYTEFAKRLGYAPWPDVIAGTSVGALNGVNVAARNIPGVLRISKMWQEMEIRRVYRVRPLDVATAFYNSFWSTGAFALLDARPLYSLVRRQYPTVDLREAIAFGDTRAFIVSATELDTGVNTLFVDSHDPALWLRPPPGTKIRRGRITVEHCLASAALPLLFEPVKIDGRMHVDGMLRQNTPVRPVIQSGCHRIMVIGIESRASHPKPPAGPVVPTLAFIGGHALNAVLMDPVDRDLRHAESINNLIRWGTKRYGAEFAHHLRADLGLHEVDVLRICPSEDLGTIARQAFRDRPPKCTAAVWALLSLLADPPNVGESDLLSFLLFDKAFTAEIEALGFEDARRNEEAMARFMLSA